MHPVIIDHHDERLLAALGYKKDHTPAHWEDIGTGESGPHLVGGEAYALWACKIDEKTVSYIIVVNHEIVEQGVEPAFLYEQPDFYD
jgi:hypothetical protein